MNCNFSIIGVIILLFCFFYYYNFIFFIILLFVFIGDDLLKADKTFHMSPLQLYALCARLKLPEAACGQLLLNILLSNILCCYELAQHLVSRVI